MNNNITINGKNYKLPTIDFNAVCDLDDLGFHIGDEQTSKKIFGSIRALSAFVMGTDLATAGKEIEEHIKNGGSFDDFAPLFDMINKSDFFTMTEATEKKKAIKENH